MIFLLHFYSLFQISVAQTCKSINKEINLLNIAEGETYTLNLTNFFIGDALMYSLDERFGYFQSNMQYFIKESRVFRSMTQFNLNQNPKNSIFAHYALVEQYDDHIMQVDIFKSHLDSTNRFIFLQEFQNDLFFNCYDITQFQNYLLLTCIDIDKQEIFFYFIDPLNYQSRFLKYRFKIWKVKQKQFKVKSFGYFVALHIVNQLDDDEEEIKQFNLNFKLYIFQVNTIYQNQQLKIKGMEQFIIFENVMDFVIQDSFLMWVKYNEPGIYFLNMISENHEQIQILTDVFDEIYFGISLVKLQTLQQFLYTIAIWDEKYIYTFLWNLEEPQKSLQKFKYFQNGQITIDNTFHTQVYLSYQYLVVANINGISIFPTFSNLINDGLQLYYYPVSSLLSSFDFIIQILLVLESSGINTYYIANPQFKVVNFKQRDEYIEIYARTNQYGKQIKYCSKLKLFLKQVESPVKSLNFIQKESFITTSDTLHVKIEKKKQQSTYSFEFHKYFVGPILNFKIIEKCNSQQLDGTIQVTKNSFVTESNNWIQLSKNQKRCSDPWSILQIENHLSFIRYEAFNDYIQFDKCWAEQLEEPFYCEALSKVAIVLPTTDVLSEIQCLQYGNTIYLLYLEQNLSGFNLVTIQIKNFVGSIVKVKIGNYPGLSQVQARIVLNFMYICFRYLKGLNQYYSRFQIVNIQRIFSNDDSNFQLFVEFNINIKSFHSTFFDFGHYIFLHSIQGEYTKFYETVTVITHNEKQIFIIGTIKQKIFLEKQQSQNQFFVTNQGILRKVFSNPQQKQIYLFITIIDIQLAILRLSQNYEIFFEDIPAHQIMFPNKQFEPTTELVSRNFIYFFTGKLYDPIKAKTQLIYVYKYSNTILNWAYYIIELEYLQEGDTYDIASFDDTDIFQYNSKVVVLQKEPRIQVNFHESDSQTCQRIKFNFEVQQSLQNIDLLPIKVFKQIEVEFIDQEEQVNIENDQDLNQ